MLHRGGGQGDEIIPRRCSTSDQSHNLVVWTVFCLNVELEDLFLFDGEQRENEEIQRPPLHWYVSGVIGRTNEKTTTSLEISENT